MALTVKDKQEISEALKSYIDPSNPERSGNAVAAKSGVSSSYISRIKDGIFVYTNGNRESPISDAIFNRLASAIGFIQEDTFHWDFVTNYKYITKMCRKAKNKILRMILDGPTGQGKTWTLERFSKENDYVIYVKCTQNMTAKDLVEALSERLEISTPYRGIYDRLKLIEKVVTSRKGLYLIIIDESEVVKSGIYSVIKDIADFVNGKAGLIICGIDLINKIEKLAMRQKPGFPQLKRRFFGNPFYIDAITIEDIASVCAHEGISNVGAVNVLQQNVTNFDQLVQWVGDILDWQKANGKKITGQETIELFNITVTTFKRAA